MAGIKLKVYSSVKKFSNSFSSMLHICDAILNSYNGYTFCYRSFLDECYIIARHSLCISVRSLDITQRQCQILKIINLFVVYIHRDDDKIDNVYLVRSRLYNISSYKAPIRCQCFHMFFHVFRLSCCYNPVDMFLFSLQVHDC